jgi:hypothetical protein
LLADVDEATESGELGDLENDLEIVDPLALGGGDGGE